jgi:sulfate transport system ATP-binding protein
MEVADEIVVINDGRVEQVGTPDQLYDEPANDFVMGFLGEITHLNGVMIRPHDVHISRSPELSGASEGTVSRVLRVGFEVRATVLTDDGEDVNVVLTRTHARQLGLDVGVRVWVTAASGALTMPAPAISAGADPVAPSDQAAVSAV